MNKKKILITGGAGYIGSHTCVVLMQAGFEIVVLDNFCNSSEIALTRVKKIVGRDFKHYVLDVRDTDSLRNVFAVEKPFAVIHFAGLKSVNESIDQALNYYDNNIAGTLSLLKVMKESQVYKLIFSSSATVYQQSTIMPIAENSLLSACQPYGQSKLMIEEIIRDIVKVDANWQVAILRYFNPVGNHESGLIGEAPCGKPNNLLPLISQVASGELANLSIFGNDYPTLDGTGVRDYVHVMDLAKGHVAALQAIESWHEALPLTVNLGTGRGYSVLEMIHAFEAASAKVIPYKMVGRRAGDLAVCLADPSLAATLLDWQAKESIEKICADTWLWQSMNPQGYTEI